MEDHRVFVSQAEIDQINGRMRRRVLHLPLKRGSLGELKRCPVRKGGVYRLRPPIPHAVYVERASSSPTRARAVLSLIDLCETPVRTTTITVTSVERHGDVWLIHFAKGDRASDLDRPIFLSKDGGYTMISSRQAVPGDPEVQFPFAEDLAKARTKARERRVTPERAAVQRARGDMETLQESMTNMKIRVLLKRALRNLEAADRLLSAEAVHSDPSAAADGSQGEADRPSRGASLASSDIEAMTEAEFAALNGDAEAVMTDALKPAA